ncbi:MAG: hypothetical protein R2831_06175 [Chitinophagaceae bacterium]
MHEKIKTAFAIILGIVIAMMCIALFDKVNQHYFPSNKLNPTLKELIDDIQNLPTKAYWLMFAGYMFSTFFGAYAASRVAPQVYKKLSAFAIGFFLLIGGIVYFISIPQPAWYSILTSIGFLVMPYFAFKAQR